jgi:hypothetical protein
VSVDIVLFKEPQLFFEAFVYGHLLFIPSLEFCPFSELSVLVFAHFLLSPFYDATH